MVVLDTDHLTLADIKPIHWPGGINQTPPDMPRCGFTGKSPQCAVVSHDYGIKEWFSLYIYGFTFTPLHRTASFWNPAASHCWSRIAVCCLRIRFLSVSNLGLADGSLRLPAATQDSDTKVTILSHGCCKGQHFVIGHLD